MDFTSETFADRQGADGSDKAGTGLIYLTQFKDLAKIKDVFANPSTDEEEVTIDGDHEWKAGKGAVPFEWDTTTEDTKLNAMMNGEGKGANTKFELIAKYPGKSRKVEAFLKKRPAIIAFAGDLKCSSGKFVQIGTRCMPAFVSAFEYIGGNAVAGDNKGYLITITAFADGIVNYDGAITLAS